NLARRFLQGFIGADDERHRIVDEERVPFEDRGDRYVGRQPQHERVPDVADVIAARGRGRERLAVALRGSQAHANAGMTGEPLDAAYDHHRTEHPPAVIEPRREIGDLDGAAGGVGHARDDHGCVVQVLLLDAGAVQQLDREEPDVVARLEERAEHRIAVEAREAGPGDFGRGIDERADRAVADQCEIERSHCSTAFTLSRRHRATVSPAPTLMECPPSWLTVANPNSSLASSPTNTGVRPPNGGSALNSSSARPLALRRSAPCCPAAGNCTLGNKESMSMMGRPLMSATAPPAH